MARAPRRPVAKMAVLHCQKEERRIKWSSATRQMKKMKSIKQDVRTACEEGESRGTVTMCKARVA